MLDDLGNLGDFLGGIAVIITIGYLALQIRQNTAALRVASRQQVVESYRLFNRPFISDPAISSIWERGLRSATDLEESDRAQFFALFLDQVLHFQGAQASHASGSLDDETFNAYRDHFAGILASPGGAVFWSQARVSYPSHMVASVEERLARGSLPDPLPFLPSPPGRDPTP